MLPGLKIFFFKGLIIVLIISQTKLLSAQNKISNYVAYFGVGEYAEKEYIIIRKYDFAGKVNYIGIDPDNLKTFVLQSAEVSVRPADWYQITLQFSKSAYVKTIQEVLKQSVSLQNSGIAHGSSKLKGISVTVDLCPSFHPLDRVIFTSLISECGKTEHPVPVAFSITGRFMANHKADLNWLLDLQKVGNIDITWVNHTYNHRYRKDNPIDKNFLLQPKTNLDLEIFEIEKALLKKNIVFSVFFRFPGLVSDQKLIDEVAKYGLIPVGSDAWLAKGQKPSEGSIVLIHGNGNEPFGVRNFISYLHTKKASILDKQWRIYDLRENVESALQN